jgi:SGNH domain (fused to AT3 domains)
VLLGDSHANHLAEPLEQFALQRGANFDVIAKNACLPLLLTGQRDDHGFCDPVCKQIKFHGAEFVIMDARWNFYLGLPASDPIDLSDLLLPRPLSDGPQDPYQVLERGLEATITEAIGSGVTRILLIASLPEFPWYPPHCVMTSIRAGAEFCAISRQNVENRRGRTVMLLQQVAARHHEIKMIDPIDLFCTTSQCRPNDGRKLYFSDTNHLSQAGIDTLETAFHPQFLWALTGSAMEGRR